MKILANDHGNGIETKQQDQQTDDTRSRHRMENFLWSLGPVVYLKRQCREVIHEMLGSEANEEDAREYQQWSRLPHRATYRQD